MAKRRGGAAAPRRWPLQWIAFGVVAFGFANFLAFWIAALVLGGSALNGRTAAGHYFLGDHGVYTEVSREVRGISLIHSIVTFASFPFLFLAMAYLLLRFVFPYLMGGRVGDAATAISGSRVENVRASGPATWSGSPGGVVGEVQSSVGMLSASVHPGGIVVMPRFMAAVAIPLNEIRDVRFGSRFLQPTIEIDHVGAEIASPFILFGSANSPQAAAIRALFESRAAAAPEAAGGDRPVEGAPSAAVPPLDYGFRRPTTVRGRPPAVLTAMSLLGLGVGVVMIGAGVLVVIPQFGEVGVVWTVFAALIVAFDAIRFVRRGW